jgi:hypothetical protein
MSKIKLKEIEKKIEKIASNKLKADDIRFNRCVYIIQEDGSAIFYKNAFLCRYFTEAEVNGFIQPDIDTWIVVFTEHYGTQIYYEDDLIAFNQFHNVAIEELE